jgi:hypothetical protein
MAKSSSLQDQWGTRCAFARVVPALIEPGAA